MNLQSLIETITDEYFCEFWYPKLENDWHVMHIMREGMQTYSEALEFFKI